MSKPGLVMSVLLICLISACHSHKSSTKKSGASSSSYAATRDGHYRVRKGDSLHAIAFKYGVDWRDIASLNKISKPYLIYPDQQLKLPPVRQGASSGKSKSAAATGILPSKSSAGTSSPRPPDTTTTTALKTPAASTTKPASNKARAPAPAAKPAPSAWRWPTSGKIISNFKANDPARNGIDISGKEGQAIIATAAGEVVYSGNGLIGYGELIIIKHNDQMLSAYAHNRKRLVSEGENVAAGAKIAEMGRNGRNQALLHFEIRTNGTPKNPLNYLPSR